MYNTVQYSYFYASIIAQSCTPLVIVIKAKIHRVASAVGGKEFDAKTKTNFSTLKSAYKRLRSASTSHIHILCDFIILFTVRLLSHLEEKAQEKDKI